MLAISKPFNGFGGRSLTYTLMDNLDIFSAHAQSPCPSHMPPCLSAQILYHDPRKDNHLGIDTIQNRVVG